MYMYMYMYQTVASAIGGTHKKNVDYFKLISTAQCKTTQCGGVRHCRRKTHLLMSPLAYEQVLWNSSNCDRAEERDILTVPIHVSGGREIPPDLVEDSAYLLSHWL